jgi:hypothetical protein
VSAAAVAATNAALLVKGMHPLEAFGWGALGALSALALVLMLLLLAALREASRD